MDITREYTEDEVRDAMNKVNDCPRDALQFLVQYMFAQHRVTTANDPEIHKQMTAKVGIKKFGEIAVRALAAEFEQFDRVDVFKVVDPTKLTNEQKRMALRAINLIKLKRCGKMKGRTVADGRPQRAHYDKTQTSSPTVHNDSVMLSILIDSMENRSVGIADIPGAYLNANMKDFTLIKFTGESVDILCKVNPNYEQYVITENGRRVICLQLAKALYGCVVSALLWYELFSKTLTNMGFTINPYDMCVANRQIDGQQCTIVWYVDDVKVSHKSDKVGKKIIDAIGDKFGGIVSHIGQQHTYLGMNLTYNDDKTVTINMSDYIKEVIQAFEAEGSITSSAATPAKSELFMVNSLSKRLSPDKSNYSITAWQNYYTYQNAADWTYC